MAKEKEKEKVKTWAEQQAEKIRQAEKEAKK
jgi:hypothetical protein